VRHQKRKSQEVYKQKSRRRHQLQPTAAQGCDYCRPLRCGKT